jgi:phosphomevalonate kinase
VILFGEYAVLEGGSALVSATSRRAEATFRSTVAPPPNMRDERFGQRVYTIDAGHLGVTHLRCTQDEVIEREGPALPFAEKVLMSLSAPEGEYRIDTSALAIQEGDDWVKLGLGSSGASTAALIHLISQLRGESTSPRERYRLTQEIHHHVQGGLGSGADVASSAYGGLIRYRWRSRHHPQVLLNETDRPWLHADHIELASRDSTSTRLGRASVLPLTPLPWEITCVWMGRSASTTALVHQIQRWASGVPDEYLDALRAIESAEAEAFQVLSDPLNSEQRRTLWSQIVARGGEAVRRLGERAGVDLWTVEHTHLEALLSPLGVSVKPTGAGGGDLALIVAPSPDDHRRALETLKSNRWIFFTL